MKRVIRFGKKDKLNPWYMESYKIFDKIGDVAYKLTLPPILVNVHNAIYQY